MIVYLIRNTANSKGYKRAETRRKNGWNKRDR